MPSMLTSNIRAMYEAVGAGNAFDVIIVVSATEKLAKFWQQRLAQLKGQVLGEHTRVSSVVEDWPGGAGQLLGTLYAWQKACQQEDLLEALQGGASVAMYHTAGRGTRMAPLPGSEANNKPAIKLPRVLGINGKETLATLLDMVVFQTGIFAASRKGRLCVFWGDRVFIPSAGVAFAGTHHAEIFCIRQHVPDGEEQWKEGWQSYGLVISQDRGDALQREKHSWEEFQGLRRRGLLRYDASGRPIVGKSLGSFSISTGLLEALLDEFAGDLARKEGRLDTDRHLWMPLTSSQDEFLAQAGDPGLWERLHRLKESFFKSKAGGLRLFGDKDMGRDTLWWDYGQLRLYWANTLKLLESSQEGEALRRFYLVGDRLIKERKTPGLSLKNTVMLDSRVERGQVEECVLLGVKAVELNVRRALLVNSSLGSLEAERALTYNVVEPGRLDLPPDQVVADIFSPADGKIRMGTSLQRDGGADWGQKIQGNPYSYDEIERLMDSTGFEDAEAERARWDATHTQ